MELDDVTRKILGEVSSETGVVGYEVERVIESCFKGSSLLIQSEEPVHIRWPFLGTIFPKSKFIKDYEANNSGG